MIGVESPPGNKEKVVKVGRNYEIKRTVRVSIELSREQRRALDNLIKVVEPASISQFFRNLLRDEYEQVMDDEFPSDPVIGWQGKKDS